MTRRMAPDGIRGPAALPAARGRDTGRDVTSADHHVPVAPPVRRPVMLQHWRRLTFLHWRYPPQAVQALLPPGLELGAPFAAAELGPLDHFLTARYRLWTVVAGRLAAAAAEHPPWSLRRARLVDLDKDLLEAAGLPPPEGMPVVHASDGVRVRIGVWHRVAAMEPRPA